ncbi:MAG TPA: CAP domain-containing protein [Candidatus Magasanikbacteria bacterium]|nr:CAP domain-containing protein [Candidatus Magasanikbacteria bacterium]
MSAGLKHFFIPHEGNNYHPHALHHARIFFYGFFGVVVKMIVVLTALLLPAQAYVVPEVLVAQDERVIDLTNEIRAREGIPLLEYSERLAQSSLHKALDMTEQQYFEHVSPQGKRLRDFLKDVGYAYSIAGENLAVGFSSPESMVEAWVESPTHYANLIDPDFNDIGIGSSVGMYGNNIAVYVAQHFGHPSGQLAFASDSRERVRGISETNGDVIVAEPYYDFGSSQLSWKKEGEKLVLHAQARIVGSPSRVTISAQGYGFELYDTHEEGIWSGTITVSESLEDFFAAVVPAEIVINWEDGEVTNSSIEWQSIPVIPMGIIQKYELSKRIPAVLGTISPVSRGVLVGLIIFFSCALILKIFIQIRHQHYHVIASVLALIGFLTLLVIV